MANVLFGENASRAPAGYWLDIEHISGDESDGDEDDDGGERRGDDDDRDIEGDSESDQAGDDKIKGSMKLKGSFAQPWPRPQHHVCFAEHPHNKIQPSDVGRGVQKESRAPALPDPQKLKHIESLLGRAAPTVPLLFKKAKDTTDDDLPVSRSRHHSTRNSKKTKKAKKHNPEDPSRLGDYSSPTRRLLKTAKSYYRLNVTTSKAYPDSTERDSMAKLAYTNGVYYELGSDPDINDLEPLTSGRKTVVSLPLLQNCTDVEY